MDIDGSNGAVLRSNDLVLHLHGLEDDQHVASLDRSTGSDLDIQNVAGHGSLDGDGTGSTGGTGTTQKTDGTGKGIIANTYAGVNVRSGAGIANAIVGKILNGTEVTILEVKLVGAAKWGRVKQGWICMDYVTMISYDDIPGNNSNNGSSGNKGTGVDSFDEAERTTTTAVYTGSVKADTTVYKTPNPNLKDCLLYTSPSPRDA